MSSISFKSALQMGLIKDPHFHKSRPGSAVTISNFMNRSVSLFGIVVSTSTKVDYDCRIAIPSHMIDLMTGSISPQDDMFEVIKQNDISDLLMGWKVSTYGKMLSLNKTSDQSFKEIIDEVNTLQEEFKMVFNSFKPIRKVNKNRLQPVKELYHEWSF